MKIYLDTSIYGVISNKKDYRYILTKNLFDVILNNNVIRIYYSPILLHELKGAPVRSRKILEKLILNKKAKQLRHRDEIKHLAYTYMNEGVLTPKSIEDAAHIAYASFYNIDLVLTWNMKHMANFIAKEKYNDVNLRLGYPAIRIRTGEEGYKLLTYK